ncbi:MAG: universal stress protein [Hyphomonadaceae bacterium]
MKDILVPVLRFEEDRIALEAAGDIAARFGARALVLHAAVRAESAHAGEYAPLSEALGRIAQGAREMHAIERDRIRAWIEARGAIAPFFELTAEDAIGADEAAAHARYADVTLLTLPRGTLHAARRELLLDVLFKSGRPLLALPVAWRAPQIGQTILLAWDAKREAARAVADAMAFLAAARRVVIATVDAKPGKGGHGPQPGSELAAFLARRGANVLVRNLDGMGKPAGVVLLEEADAIGADLIVAGGYGHTRAQERVFGGVTQHLLHASARPLFLSH